MSWAETLTINSDPSTPLNELFTSLFMVKESDEVLYNVGTGNGNTTTGEKDIIAKTIGLPGAIKIKANMDASVTINIYINDVQQGTLAVTSNETDSERTINVSKGDIIRLTNKGSAQSGRKYRDLRFCGTVGFAVPVIM